jgi:hypothetical protein
MFDLPDAAPPDVSRIVSVPKDRMANNFSDCDIDIQNRLPLRANPLNDRCHPHSTGPPPAPRLWVSDSVILFRIAFAFQLLSDAAWNSKQYGL